MPNVGPGNSIEKAAALLICGLGAFKYDVASDNFHRIFAQQQYMPATQNLIAASAGYCHCAVH